MQRKAYVTGTAALLAALLAGCSGGSGGGAADDANPGDAGTATVAAQPGRYRTLPEPCGAVSHGTLDALLPGIRQIADPDQRDKAYQGEAELTYDTDRKVGCRWKVPSAGSTDRLSVDLERVVSYDNTVSDDDQARDLFEQKESAAGLPAASDSPSASTPSGSSDASPSASPSPSGSASGTPSAPSAPSASDSPSGAMAPELQPRTLSDLGDEAYLDDKLGSSGSTAAQRTVTVVFRTSNVVVTIQYEEQPMAAGAAPDSKEMQDRARNLAAKLDDALGS
ncbi:hypothetical protein [Streptomyces malaysiense]|uniref:DUF3558 domain-containing protein n=1 Tax=Streptomyces malaysiense TaxID=1428626 RepID=A0A1J4PXI0_9ACTN|nr:hypothetical protein [Streptomyces malaysiense]OIK24806.1 hypothetical protein VT52_024720 [Streptomyces malaysiense]